MTRKTHVHLSDLVGVNRLATDATAELTDLAKALAPIAGSARIGSSHVKAIPAKHISKKNQNRCIAGEA
jgi:hypothetical protein